MPSLWFVAAHRGCGGLRIARLRHGATAVHWPLEGPRPRKHPRQKFGPNQMCRRRASGDQHHRGRERQVAAGLISLSGRRVAGRAIDPVVAFRDERAGAPAPERGGGKGSGSTVRRVGAEGISTTLVLASWASLRGGGDLAGCTPGKPGAACGAGISSSRRSSDFTCSRSDSLCFCVMANVSCVRGISRGRLRSTGVTFSSNP